jgi:hypothetical protein
LALGVDVRRDHARRLCTAFLLQQLWNWFVIRALHLEPVSYWVSYGIFMLINVFSGYPVSVEDAKWRRTLLILNACVPYSEREELTHQLEIEKESDSLDAVSAIFGKVFGTSLTLGVGWAVHTFLL